MTASKTMAGLAAATALAALSGVSFSAPAFAQDGGKLIHCYGVNSCKGQSDCKSGNHDCKAMNDCKGQGFKEMTSKACAAAGGSLTAPSK
ncbi:MULTISPECIES: BufA2 family periplasmic bufferin-type metallophore [Phenylobacterium]|uniref:Membrane protein n=1 Tax=Phenylobacterium koreense TaxID=266125 RepID=A0ABV2EGS9_9CAUL